MKYKHIRFVLFQKEHKNHLLSGLFALLFCLGIPNAFGQQEHTISGVVSDLNTGETLIGVNVLIPELRAG
ncbi:MAG: hypothetical protein O3A41_03130, partial [Bacteroidetes bacterium]|nr:hypothetical protein [Bacteroidota bacterium]